MKLKTYTIKDIPATLWLRVRHRALDEARTIRELILDALREYLDKR